MAHKARKRFGQHFLTDASVLDQIARQLGDWQDQTVIEIGPGQGALTEYLLASGNKLIAIELDRDLVAHLHQRYPEEQLTVISADILNVDLTELSKQLGARKLTLIGNLPYNISTPLIFHLLEHYQVIGDMVFMLQQEVAQRLLAKPGNKQWGRLSVMTQRTVHCDRLFDVPPEAFSPPPKVMSTVIRMSVRKTQPEVHYLPHLNEIVQAAFSQRRKTLRNSLKDLLNEQQIKACEIDPTIRPEQISVEQFVRLANLFSASALIK